MIRIKKVQIPGLPTKEPRRLYIYLPAEYGRSEKRYPVLYMFDGHNVFYDSHATYGKSWGMKEYLTRTRLPLIVAAIECNHEGERRLNEYAPWDFEFPDLGKMEGLGAVTMDWICGPLKEYMDRNYRTLPDREHTLVGGSSMGGLMALYAAVAYNEVFSKAAALSTFFHAGGENIYALLKEPLKEPSKIYMDIGTGEVGEQERSSLAELFRCAEALACAGADVSAQLVPGALHNEAAWEKRIPVFMDYLLGGDM